MKTKYDIVFRVVTGFVIIFSIFSTLYQPFPKAEAHNGLSLSGFTSIPPNIDGILQPNEWVHASRQDFVTMDNKVSGTMYVMNDKTNLYIALSIKDKSDSIRSKMIFFDNNHTGQIQIGDSVWDFSGGLTEARISSVEPYTESWSPDHPIDGSFAASTDHFYNYVELSHPLCSHNSGDFCLVAGQAMGFTIRFTGDYAVHEWPGSLEEKDNNASGWGDIVVVHARGEKEQGMGSLTSIQGSPYKHLKNPAFKRPESNSNSALTYNITGAKVFEIKKTKPFNSLLVSLKPIGKGSLRIAAPQTWIDSIPNAVFYKFIVLLNGEKTHYDEYMTDNGRILEIPFENYTKQIKIITVYNCYRVLCG